MQNYYLLRSRQNGDYIAARQPAKTEDEPPQRYVLLFKHDHDAMGYLNAHAGDVSDRFAVEMSPLKQIKLTLERLGFTGVGFVSDPLVPHVDFMERRFL